MKNKDLKEEIKAEQENLEYEDYERSGSEDTFETWKLKKYVDSRFYQLLVGIAVGLIVIFLLNKYF